jgi:RNA recognition motif-containing protein
MGNRLFVGNLSYQTTDAELRSEFSKCGTVKDARVITDRETGRSRGFGFVEFATDGEAATAIQALDQQQLGGRNISVREAEQRQGGPRPSGGGGGSRPSNNRPSFSAGGGGGGYNNSGGYSGGGGGSFDGGGKSGKSRKGGKGSRRRNRDDNDYSY